MRRSPLAWLGGLLALYLAVPLVAFFIRVSSSHQRGFATPGLWSALRTSVESATIATAVIAVVGIPLAFVLARHRGPWASLVSGVVALPLAVPPVMSGILLIYLVGPYTTVGKFFGGRLTGSVAGIVLAQVFVAAPFLVLSARASFDAVDRSLEDLAASGWTCRSRPAASGSVSC
jgi:ABC-type sulfate transport system permease component